MVVIAYKQVVWIFPRLVFSSQPNRGLFPGATPHGKLQGMLILQSINKKKKKSYIEIYFLCSDFFPHIGTLVNGILNRK